MTNPPHRAPRAARNILSNWATFVFSAGVNFFLSPIVVRALGETQYGAWVLLVSMVGYLGLLDLGVRGAVTRYIATAHAAADHAGANRIYASALRIFSAGGAVAIVIAVVMATLVGRVFNVPRDLIPVARLVVLIGGVNVAVSLLSGVFGGVVIGLQRFDYSNAVEISVGTLRAVAVATAVKTGHGLIALALIQLAASVARGAADVVMARRLYPELELRELTWHPESVRLIVNFGLTSALLQVAVSLMLYSDSMVIGALLPVGMITFFAIAGNLSEYARAVAGGVSITVSPRVSALQATGDHAGIQSAVLASARLASLVVLPIAATFMLRGSSFVGLWMGPEYADLAGRVLLTLSISLVTLGGYQVVGAAMVGLNKHRGLIPIFVLEAITNFALSIVWVRAYGVIGSAMGTVVPRVLMGALVLPWYAKRMLGIPLRAFWTSVLVRPIFASMPFAVATYAVERLAPARNLATFFGQVILTLPIAGVAAWFLCLSVNEQTAVRQVVGRLTTRPA